MSLKHLEIVGFKSFAKKAEFEFGAPITAIVGPNGSGKSNVAEAFRFVLGEQSIKSLRGKKGEDLIFNGEGARANRAAVKVIFNNAPRQTPEGEQRLLPVEYDEVSIERAVFRDGTNEYAINGSKVRLKDVTELLASANIGSSGHHIISQGEADRVLSASPKERRAMIEDALGLRLYQYKKQESRKKLEKTRENQAQVESLRRENQPHLKFLERQVAKIERSRVLREELSGVYKEYLKREERYLMLEEDALQGEREEPERKLAELTKRIEQLRGVLEQESADHAKNEATLALERELSMVRDEVARLARELGSIEGQISFEERRIAGEKRKQESIEHREISVGEVTELTDDIDASLNHIESIDDLGQIRKALHEVRERLRAFKERVFSEGVVDIDESELVTLREKKSALERTIDECRAKQDGLEAQYRAQKETLEREKDESREAERELFVLMQEQNDARVRLAELNARADRLLRDQDEFKRELAEAAALMGRDVLGYKEHEIVDDAGNAVSLDDLFEEDRGRQEERRRELERMKIRLEELGGANVEEIMREYREVKERDAFLAREIEDLELSAQSLEDLIASLETELEERFQDGIELISSAFSEFFSSMFGGGKASLAVVREKKKRKLTEMLGLAESEEIPEEDEGEDDDVLGEMGVEVNVALPNKKVKGLMMLSGGERALTSIALIFAMSRVNPPPFLILDETDAALDEANSKRYADMIETLAMQSQLIVITHNRETMSRAGVLYGVTMGADGISKLLSVKFEEGAQFAK